jgi:uncharacterized protein
MKSGKIAFLMIGLLVFMLSWTRAGNPAAAVTAQEKDETEWRKERDVFFRTHQRSPLSPEQKKSFKGLTYYPIDPKYVFSGQIQRYILNINDPHYYATFLTNKGTKKRYVRYGKFQFQLDGHPYSLELYKSILSDALFIPFEDKTNGKETYEAGRYVDAEILEGYRMTVDFNRAYNPSCVYNERFTCAMPPKENSLNVEIRAGEKHLKTVPDALSPGLRKQG